MKSKRAGWVFLPARFAMPLRVVRPCGRYSGTDWRRAPPDKTLVIAAPSRLRRPGRFVRKSNQTQMQNAFHFSEVRLASPPAAYLGGKRQLAARIAALIEQIPHDLYAEPFTGKGGVFLRRRLIPRAEIINDISGDVVTLFRILQRHFPQLMDVMKFQITSRREFDRLASVDPAVQLNVLVIPIEALLLIWASPPFYCAKCSHRSKALE